MGTFKGTKGEFTFSSQKGTKNHCFQAQVWTTSKSEDVAIINSTYSEEEANANAELFTDALNTINEYGLSPTELMFQKRELLEQLIKSKVTISRMRRSMAVHPDCTTNSEFEGYTDMAQEAEAEIELLIKKITA